LGGNLDTQTEHRNLPESHTVRAYIFSDNHTLITPVNSLSLFVYRATTS
jgi:hypothetical protein